MGTQHERIQTSRPASTNEQERIQTIGLGSVLIATVAFAAAFTVPGGYGKDDGIPVWGRKYAFRAFVLANTLAFVQAFGLLYILGMRTLRSVVSSSALELANELETANIWFLGAANCMGIAFGLGSYVVLAPVSMPLTIIVLVLVALFASCNTPIFLISSNLSEFR